MAEEEVQSYGLDATDYFEAVEAIVRKNRTMANSLVALGEKIQGADKIANQFATNFRNLKDAPEGFAAALKLLGGEYDETKDKITVTDAALAKHLETIRTVTKAYDTDLMRSVEQFVDGEKRKTKALTDFENRLAARNRTVRGGDPSSPLQSKDELKAVGEGISQRQRAREKEVRDLEQAMLQQVKDFEQAEKEKTRIAAQEQAARDAKNRVVRPRDNARGSENRVDFDEMRRTRIYERVARRNFEGTSTAGARYVYTKEKEGGFEQGYDPIISKINADYLKRMAKQPKGLAQSSPTTVQSREEVETLKRAYLDRMKLRQKEVEDLEKVMLQQVKDFEKAEKEKTKLAKEEEKARLKITKDSAKAAAEAAAEVFRRNAESKVQVPLGKNPAAGARAADAAGGIADLIQKQKITADRAQQIINQITGGQNAVLSGVDARVGKMARAMHEAQKELNDFSVEKPKQQIDDLNDSFVEAEEKSKQASKGVLLSWQSMARLFVIQALHTVVREFINEIQNAVDTAAQWQIKISEIRTITQDQQLSFEQWGDAVRRLSDEFGNPILEVTAGLYETISNQVGKGATAINFMSTAMQFGKVTGASTADSVNLLSAALNSFGLSTVHSERVAAIFFKTIDKGRVRADEVANTFGRVGPSAKALGLSMEEVSAALATLTIRGVPPAEAMTLLNNVMNGLVKPSKEMKEFFSEIGVASGEQAVSVNGFANVLAKLEQKSKGAAGELGELFTNIRGQRGITIFTGEGLKNFQDNLNAMLQAEKDYNEAKKRPMESPGAQLLKQLNEVQNIAVADIAQPILKAALQIANAFGGMANVFKATMTVGTPLLKLFVLYKLYTYAAAGATAAKVAIDKLQVAVSVANAEASQLRAMGALAEARAEAFAAQAGALRTAGLEAESIVLLEAAQAEQYLATSALASAAAMKTQTASSVLMRGAMSGLASVLTNPAFLLVGAIAGITYLISKYNEWEEEVATASKKAYEGAVTANQEITKVVERELAKQSEAYEKSLNSQFSAYIDFALKIQDQIEALADKQKEMADAADRFAKEGISDLRKTYESNLSAIESAHKKTIDTIRKTEEELDSRRETFADRQFKRNLKLAEHADRMADPKAKGAVQAAQMAIVSKEIKRLRSENITLVAPTGDFEKDADNREKAAKNLQKIDDLLTTQADRRLGIEEDKQKVVSQIAEIEAKMAAEAKERGIKDAQAAITDAKGSETRRHRDAKQGNARQPKPPVFNERERHDEVADALANESGNLKSGLTAAQREEQDQLTAAKLAELKVTLANYDASLHLLPKIADIQQQGLDIEKETNDQLAKRLVALKALETQQSATVTKQKAEFDRLKITLEDLEKFKLDPKFDPKSQADVDLALKKFDDLINKAQVSGLQDQSLLKRLVDQKIAIENQAQVKLKANQEKDNLSELEETKKVLQARGEAQTTQLADLQKKATEAANQLYSVIGGPAHGQFQKGPMEEFGSGFALGMPGANLEKFSDQLLEIRNISAQLVQMQADVTSGKAKADPAKIDKLTKSFTGLMTAIQAATYTPVEAGAEGPNFNAVESIPLTKLALTSGRKDELGNPLLPLTVGDEINRAQAAVNTLVATLTETTKQEKLRADQQAALATTTAALSGLQASYGQNAQAIQAQSKSFQQLTTDVLNVVQSMQSLKVTLDAMAKNPQAVGQPLPKFALGGSNMGTDTMVAAVSPGEFIVNARSTRKFYRQLMSMNRYADGGMIDFNPNFSRPVAEVPTGMSSDSSISFSVGQIVVQGNGNPEYDARQIGRALEKEIRRGTINLRANNEA